MPALIEPAVQKPSVTPLALWNILRCSQYFVKMMYQLPIDMISMTIRLNLAIQPPSRHSAPRPYGLSIVSLPAAAGATGATPVSTAAGAGVAEASEATAAGAATSGADAWARAEVGMAATVASARSAAAKGVRIEFRKDMFPPREGNRPVCQHGRVSQKKSG